MPRDDDGPDWGVYLRNDQLLIADTLSQEDAIACRAEMLEPDYQGGCYHPNDVYIAAIWRENA